MHRNITDSIYTSRELAAITKLGLNPAQRAALRAYNFAEKQEDRYLGSVFVTPAGQARHRAETRVAYEACVALGMTQKHGL